MTENDLIFLRQGPAEKDELDGPMAGQTVNVWLWNEANQSWLEVLRSMSLIGSARSTPFPLGEPLSPKQGKRMMSMGWHLREPVLWIEP